MEDKQIERRQIVVLVVAEEAQDKLTQFRELPGVLKANMLGADAPEGLLAADLERLLNRHSAENESMTPDFILASYLKDCLASWNKAVVARDRWWSHKPSIGGSSDMSDKINGARKDA